MRPTRFALWTAAAWLVAPLAATPALAGCAGVQPRAGFTRITAPREWQADAGKTIVAFRVSAADPRVIYVSDGPSLLRSGDGGCTWKPTGWRPANSDENVHQIEGAYAARPKTLYVTAGTARARVYRSTDEGRTWSAVDGPAQSSSYSPSSFQRCLAVSPKDPRVVAYATGTGLHVSRDSGATWTRVPPPSPTIVVGLACPVFDPAAADLWTLGKTTWTDLAAASVPVHWADYGARLVGSYNSWIQRIAIGHGTGKASIFAESHRVGEGLQASRDNGGSFARIPNAVPGIFTDMTVSTTGSAVYAVVKTQLPSKRDVWELWELRPFTGRSWRSLGAWPETYTVDTDFHVQYVGGTKPGVYLLRSGPHEQAPDGTQRPFAGEIVRVAGVR
jgi:photosystem II stability/assembly factor-like uncharacterized protein